MAKERELRPYNFEPQISARKLTSRRDNAEREAEGEGSDDSDSMPMETDGSARAGIRRISNLSVPILLSHLAHLSLSVSGFGITNKLFFDPKPGRLVQPNAWHIGILYSKTAPMAWRMRIECDTLTSLDR